MADTIAVTCPKCSKAMSVPATLAGKKVRCKGCEAAVAVPDPKAKETFKLADAPKAKPAAKPAKKAATAPAPEAPAKKPPEDDEDANPYGLTHDDSDKVRCPFCAQELDPPDARICQNCGYDMQQRKRRESKNVYQLTTGDYIKHHGTTIGAVIVIIGLIVLNVFTLMNMDSWFEGSIIEMDDKDPITGQKRYWVNPGFGKLYIGLFSLMVAFAAGRYAYMMLATKFHPPEENIHT